MANDPQGILAERNRLIRYLDQLSSSITNYSGDGAGLRDLQTKEAEVNYRLNTSSTLTGITGMPNAGGTSLGGGFILEKVSTS